MIHFVYFFPHRQILWLSSLSIPKYNHRLILGVKIATFANVFDVASIYLNYTHYQRRRNKSFFKKHFTIRRPLKMDMFRNSYALTEPQGLSGFFGTTFSNHYWESRSPESWNSPQVEINRFKLFEESSE